jgi:hypothetical protein
MARKRISMNRTILVEEPLHREQVKKDVLLLMTFCGFILISSKTAIPSKAD